MTKLIIPTYDLYAEGGPEFMGHVLVNAESIAGLYVHRSHLEWDNDWRVSLPNGFRAYPAPIDTRAVARQIARKLSPLIPTEVKTGEWTGAVFCEKDPVAAEKLREAVSGMSGRQVKWRH